MPEIDIKAQALSDARARILKLQEQMTICLPDGRRVREASPSNRRLISI
jgi:hypothetical protein